MNNFYLLTQFLSRLNWRLAAFVIITGGLASAYGYDFSRSIESARNNPSEFAKSLQDSRQILEENWFEDLKACYQNLPLREKEAFGESMAAKATEIHQMKGSYRDLHQEFQTLCAPFFQFQIGSSFYTKIEQSFLDQLANNPLLLPTLRLFTKAGQIIRTDKAIQYLEKLIPHSLKGSFAFFREPWFQEYVNLLIKNPTFQKQIGDFTAKKSTTNHQELELLFSLASPERIYFAGERQNNPTFGFMGYNRSRLEFFKSQRMKACLVDAAQLISNMENPRPTRDSIFQFYVNLIEDMQSHCPNESKTNLMTLLAIEDRFNMTLLPAFAIEQISQSDLAHPETFFEDWSPLEQFTYQLRKHIGEIGLNHVSTPSTLYCLATKIQPSWAQSIRSSIYMVGLAYQLLDIEPKKKLFGQSVQQIAKDSISDLELWSASTLINCN